MASDLHGLVLREGYSHEDLTYYLTKGEVPFSVKQVPKHYPDRIFFRSSTIEIPKKYKQRTLEMLEPFVHSMGDRAERNISVSYWGSYEMTPSFNVINLNGKLTFKAGRLVESTIVRFA